MFTNIFLLLLLCQRMSSVFSNYLCGSTIHVKWYSLPPYIYQARDQPNGKLEGVFPTLLNNVMRRCCEENTTLKFYQQLSSNMALINQIDNASLNGSYLMLPFFSSRNKNNFMQREFVPVVESPGLLYIVNEKTAMLSMEYLVMKAVSSAWPIFTLLFICAAITGIIIWALDSYWNPVQFPVSFFKGAFDGFWWACVSMTTVGYGDRAPKSVAARCYAFLWIVSSLVAVSLFTASITSQFTGYTMTANKMFTGEKLAVREDSAELKCVFPENADKRKVSSVFELRENLKSGRSSGAVIDAYIAGYYKDEYFSTGTRVLNVIDCISVYGLLMTGEYENSKFGKCLQKYLDTHKDEVTSVIRNETKPLKLPERAIDEERSLHIFYTDGVLFKYSLIIGLGIVFVSLSIGGIWQCRRKKSKASAIKKEPVTVGNIIKRMSMEELLHRQCKEMEVAMKEEVERFYEIWLKKKQEIMEGRSPYQTFQKRKKLPVYKIEEEM